MNIDSIPVRVETSEVSGDDMNIRSILVEIQHGLDSLQENEQKMIIDLGSIPLASIERARLFELLGQGEIKIHLSCLGESEIYETFYPGVWVVKHRDEQGEFSGMFIEVCEIPDIVLSNKSEIQASVIGIKELIEKL